MTVLNKARKSRRGFTLIELLVVVLILGILIAVAVPLYLSSVKSAATQAVKANLKTIGQAAQAYQVKQGTYPTNLDALISRPSDLQSNIANAGPRDVTYSLAGTGSTSCVVTATEAGQDAFGAGGTTDAGTYTVQTGQFAGLD